MGKDSGRWGFFFLVRLFFLQSLLLSGVMLSRQEVVPSERNFGELTSFKFFFVTKTASASLQLRNLTMVRSVFPSLWHVTIWLSLSLTSISSERCYTYFLRSFLPKLLAMPVIPKQSLHECCSSLMLPFKFCESFVSFLVSFL